MCDSTGWKASAGLPAIVILLSLAMMGCTKKISDKNLVFVGPGEAETLLVGKPGVLGVGASKGGVLVDPRSSAAFRAGHIPGAFSMPYETVRDDYNQLGEWSVLIVYGKDYDDPIARAMSKTLLELGFKDVRTLRGGLQAWQDAGNELETGPGG